MNTLTKRPEVPDELDRRLSDFFKNQLPHPWPKAPAAAAAPAPAEPSALVAARSPETPRNQPAPAKRDQSARARFILAASVALLLGACWYLSNGFTPGERTGGGPGGAPTGPSILKPSTADGKDSPLFQGIQKHTTENTGPGIDLHKAGDTKFGD